MALWAFLFFIASATTLNLQAAPAPLGGAQATPTGYFEGPVATAMAGTGRAAVLVTEGAHLNPATLAFVEGYNLGFIYGAESLGDRAGANKYHLVISDSGEDAMFPGALSYSRVGLFQQDRSVDIQEVNASIGYGFSEFFSWGVTAKYIHQEIKGSEKVNAFNGSTGFLLTPRRNLGFALTFDDFLEARDVAMNPTTGVGVNYVFEKLIMLRGDVVQPQKSNPSRRLIAMLGAETMFVGKDLKFRFGHRWDDFADRRLASLGLGWQGPKLGVNYAYEKNVDSTDFRHLIDMLIRF
jgi:hypothetical protein